MVPIIKSGKSSKLFDVNRKFLIQDIVGARIK